MYENGNDLEAVFHRSTDFGSFNAAEKNKFCALKRNAVSNENGICNVRHNHYASVSHYWRDKRNENTFFFARNDGRCKTMEWVNIIATNLYGSLWYVGKNGTSAAFYLTLDEWLQQLVLFFFFLFIIIVFHRSSNGTFATNIRINSKPLHSNFIVLRALQCYAKFTERNSSCTQCRRYSNSASVNY